MILGERKIGQKPQWGFLIVLMKGFNKLWSPDWK